MLFNTFLGCAIFLITNLSLLYISHLFVRRFLANSTPSVRLVSTGLLFYALIILIFQALSPFHAISKTWVTISCFLPALLLHFTWGKQRNLQAEFEPVRSWIRDGLSSRWAILLTICGFVVLLSLSRALLTPPLDVDSLKYHLTFAALWIKKGTLVMLKAPDDFTMAMHYPINGEILASWLLLPFHNDLLVNIMNFPITLLGGISCYAIARELGLTRKEASFVPALICFAPVIYSQIITQHVDNAVFAFCSVSTLFTFRYLRRGYLLDGLLSFIAAGILLGTKYTAIPAVGIIFIVSTLKTISLTNYSGFLRKLSLILFSLVIICMFGGRQYIGNAIEAGNPLYPLPLKIFHNEIFEGWPKLEQFRKSMYEYEKERGLDKFNWWEREYGKFFYQPKTAGPKFFLFFILAFFSLFIRPHDIPKKHWYFITAMWAIPIILFYSDDSTEFNRRGFFLIGSIRFLISSLALFTIQALVVVQKYRKYFRGTDFFLAALVIWDLLEAYKEHIRDIWEAVIIYPFLVLMIPLLSTLLKIVLGKLKRFDLKEKSFLIPTGSFRPDITIIRRGVISAVGLIILVVGFCFLQVYRDNTRYIHYFNKSPSSQLPRDLVEAWEYLDTLDENKTIAMTMDWPGKWFFYPLLGRWLQNDIAYISAKHKWQAPTWLDRGLLRGKNSSIWFHNLKRKNVDFILITTPWPVELKWIKQYPDNFQLVFNDTRCKIFKYIPETDLDKVISKYKEELAINPNNAKARHNIAAVYLSRGMLDEAISEYKKILALNPNYAKSLSNLGLAYYQQGKLPEAIEEYKKALTINPNIGAAHNNLSIVYYDMKDYKLAILHCSRAQELGFEVNPRLLSALQPYR